MAQLKDTEVTGALTINDGTETIDVKEELDQLNSDLTNLKSKTIDSVILTPDGTVCKQANILKEVVGKTIIITLNCEFNAVSSALPYTLIASGVPNELIPKYEIYAYAQILNSTEGLTNNACLVQIKNASVSDAGKIFIKTSSGITSGYRLRVSIPILSA